MRPNLPFLLAASNAILKNSGSLKWKKRLVKDVRLSLPLTEVMKIARLTSPLLDVLRLPLPRSRLRHGKRLAPLSRPNLTLNLYTRSVADSPSSSSNFPNCSSSRESALVFADYLRSHFSVSQPKALRSRSRGYLTELRRATYLKSLTRPSALPSPLLNFLRLPSISSRPLPRAQTKLLIPC